MNLRHAYRPWLAIILLVLAAMLSAGCSKSPTKVLKATPIPQADADDIVQLVATTLSSDNGGWYCLVKAFSESLSIAPPVLPLTAGGERWSVPLSQGIGIRNDFAITKAQVTYLMQAAWIRGDGTKTAARDTASRDMESLVSADGGRFEGVNGIELGTYGCHSYALNSTIDSTFFATNLAVSDPDTIEFSGFLDDSCFAIVHSTFMPGASGRYWYHQNFADYTLRIPKTQLVSSPYPVGALSEIHWNIEAYGLSTPGRQDFGFGELIEARMTFDGTPIGRLELADVSGDPSWSYRYTVNINTGQIARLP